MTCVMHLLACLFAAGSASPASPAMFVEDRGDLSGTNWIGHATAMGTDVFVALEFPAGEAGIVLLSMPNALAMRSELPVGGSPQAPEIDISAGGQILRIKLDPGIEEGEPRLGGDMQLFGPDKKTVVQTFPMTMQSWTPPEEMDSFELLGGTVVLPGDTLLKLRFHLGHEDGAASARMDIPAQSVSKYPCTATFDDGTWRVETNFGTPVVCTIEPDPEGGEGAHVGTMEQSGFSMPLALEAMDVGEIKRETRPQLPKPPFPYASEDVRVEHPDGHVLAGTLLLPDGVDAPPVVVFITGSGAQDRDESIMGHKPFLVIADHLARNGIASLRYDDRGFGESSGDFTEATSEDFATDALAAVAWLRTHDGLDESEIGLLGHSEGGLVAPIAVSMDPEIDFVVMLAGTGVDGGRILTSQVERIMLVGGSDPADVATVVEVHEKLMDAVRADASLDEIRERYIALTDAQLEMSRAELGDEKIEELRVMTLEQIGEDGDPLGLWMRRFIMLDPRSYLAQVTCPVLALNGTNDVQVIAELNLPEIQRAVTTGGGTVTIKEYEGLNHLFQPSDTGAVSEYAEIEITIDPEVLEDVTEWILATTRKGG